MKYKVGDYIKHRNYKYLIEQIIYFDKIYYYGVRRLDGEMMGSPWIICDLLDSKSVIDKKHIREQKLKRILK